MNKFNTVADCKEAGWSDHVIKAAIEKCEKIAHDFSFFTCLTIEGQVKMLSASYSIFPPVKLEGTQAEGLGQIAKWDGITVGDISRSHSSSLL